MHAAAAAAAEYLQVEGTCNVMALPHSEMCCAALKVAAPGGKPLRRAFQAWASPPKFRRRSEVDRRLDALVGHHGRLKDSATDSIVRMLRLFNLCDVGPTITQADVAATLAADGRRPASPAVPPPQQPAPMQASSLRMATGRSRCSDSAWRAFAYAFVRPGCARGCLHALPAPFSEVLAAGCAG
jgi:hypothetical protein